MARGKQHRGHGQHPLHATLSEPIEGIAKNRSGEFEIAVFNRQARHPWPQSFGEAGEFLDSQFVAASVTTDQDAHIGGVELG